MYLCERSKYLFDKTFITNDKLYSMRFGGVLSNVYNLMKECYKSSDASIWNDVLGSEGHGKQKEIYILDNNFKTDHLSREEKYIIEVRCKLYKDKDEQFLINLIHNRCPEWYNYFDKGREKRKLEVKPEQILY